MWLTKTLQTRASLIFTPLQCSHMSPCPAYICFKESAHDFCFRLAYVANAFFNALATIRQTLEAPTQVGSSTRSTQTTLEGSRDCSVRHREQSSATSNLVPPFATVCQSTHMHRDTHIISSYLRSSLPRQPHQTWRGFRGWLTCTGWNKRFGTVMANCFIPGLGLWE